MVSIHDLDDTETGITRTFTLNIRINSLGAPPRNVYGVEVDVRTNMFNFKFTVLGIQYELKEGDILSNGIIFSEGLMSLGGVTFRRLLTPYVTLLNDL